MDYNRGITINTEKEIYYYIKSNKTNGALLIKGKWGSGKTFLINSISFLKWLIGFLIAVAAIVVPLMFK